MPPDKPDLTTSPEEAMRAVIAAFVRDSPANRLAEIDGSPIYAEPLVGFASGADPLFEEYKRIIGPFHLTPREALEIGEREEPLTPTPSPSSGRKMHSFSPQALSQGERETGSVSVICWALPIAEATRASNRTQREVPSKRWSHTRTHGERFNDELRRHMVACLCAAGYRAVAPVITEAFVIHNEGVDRPPASTWSERHILYAAGMGTFGLSGGFITPRGMAMRCGSVVTDLPLTPSLRPYPNHTANCLFLSQGTCGKCIARCPAGAISRQGHDKAKCREYQYSKVAPLVAAYGVPVIGCGLCQTGVLCEAGIPVRE